MEGIKTRSRLAYRSIGLVLALILGIYVVFQIPHIVVLFLLTLLFAIVISGPVNYLAQMGLPRGLGVFVVLVSPALELWLASRMIIPVIEAQASQFVRESLSRSRRTARAGRYGSPVRLQKLSEPIAGHS